METQPAQIRFSGILSLIFGLLSPLCLLTPLLLFIPLIAIVLGAFALRPAQGPKPVGQTAARIGLLLAVGVGACGFFLNHFRSQTLRSQAEYFGRQYLEIVAAGYDEYAVELKKPARTRSLPTTPLKELYQRDATAVESLTMFREEEATRHVQDAGPNTEWVLKDSPRVFRSRGTDRVETTWVDRSGNLSRPIRLDLEYVADQEAGQGQWSVYGFEVDLPPPVSASPL